MLRIVNPMDESLRTLKHGKEVFHEALQWTGLGEFSFHVKNSSGEDYDLHYVENDALFRENTTTNLRFPNASVPPYERYDEHDTTKIYLDFLQPYHTVWMEEVNEYTIVAADVLMRETDLNVGFTDKRAAWFFEERKRLAIGKPLPSAQNEKVFFCTSQPECNPVFKQDKSVSSAQYLFHNLFLLQWMTKEPLSKIKYADVSLLKTEGIGAVLDHYAKIRDAFSCRNIQAFLRLESTRFAPALLRRYFDFEQLPADADEHNTIELPNFLPVRSSFFFENASGDFDTSVLNAEFASQIQEYYDNVIGGGLTLGVLIRGTDYVNLKLSGAKRQSTTEEMIPVIDEWIRKDGYEKIFLATEDQDILDTMRSYYGSKVIAIAQERHRVSDFKEGQFLSDVVKDKHENASATEEDTMVNYFYALYILSRCDSFLCSGHCNGWEIVNVFRQSDFKRSHCMNQE